jgi:hypothetical protein
VLGTDEDEAGAGEVDEGMTAHRAESDDGSPAPCPHLDLVGTRRDMVANGPFTGGRFMALVSRIPSHAATPLTTLKNASSAETTMISCSKASRASHGNDPPPDARAVLWPTGTCALLADTCHRDDPRDQALNRFRPKARACCERDLTRCPIKSGEAPWPFCLRRGGRSSRHEGGAWSADTLAIVIEAVAQPAIFRVLRILRGPFAKPD